jgi:hypothetical protein
MIKHISNLIFVIVFIITIKTLKIYFNLDETTCLIASFFMGQIVFIMSEGKNGFHKD